MTANLKNGSKEDGGLKPINQKLVEVYVTNHKRFRSYLKKHINNEAIAEDILQTSMRKAIENNSAISSEALVPFLFKIIKNTLVDFYRSRATEEKKYLDFESELKGSTGTPSELEKVVCECLADLLPTLHDDYAKVINLIDLKNETTSTVARKLGITENNLGVKLHRARSALKKSLERTCGACTKHGCLDCSCKKMD
ncbi:MAG: hypothetical protein A4S09_06390 [Proteobacteria bacterium SG_bin7]|nr:MAG: hypothetical protein A4S09_06390 [Proteobacteria bacterium SG_bin7]